MSDFKTLKKEFMSVQLISNPVVRPGNVPTLRLLPHVTGDSGQSRNAFNQSENHKSRVPSGEKALGHRTSVRLSAKTPVIEIDLRVYTGAGRPGQVHIDITPVHDRSEECTDQDKTT